MYSKKDLLNNNFIIHRDINADTCEAIEAPVRAVISLESMTLMFFKEIIRVRKEELRKL